MHGGKVKIFFNYLHKPNFSFEYFKNTSSTSLRNIIGKPLVSSQLGGASVLGNLCDLLFKYSYRFSKVEKMENKMVLPST